MNTLLNNIRNNVRVLLRINNLSNDEFARLMDWTTVDVERLLSGELLLPPRELNKIAKIFRVTYRELLSENLKLNNKKES